MDTKSLSSTLAAKAAELERAVSLMDAPIPDADVRLADSGNALVSTIYDAADRLTNPADVKSLYETAGHFTAALRDAELGWTPENKAGAVPARGRKEVSFAGRNRVQLKDAARDLIEVARVYADRLKAGRTW